MSFKRSFSALICIFLLLAFFSPTLADEKPQSLVVAGARLIDGTGRPPLTDAVIVITDDKFVAVGKKGSVNLPEGARTINVGGKTVIPGLIDAHIHFTYPPKEEDFYTIDDAISAFRAAHFLAEYLHVGVTTVRDIASYHRVGITAKKAFDKGLFTGSRPIVAGQGITCTGGHGTEGERVGIAVEVKGPDGFRDAVREQLRRGAHLIKVLPPYSKEEIQAAIEETHAWERFVTVHSGMFKEQYDFIRWAVELGADCIEHAYAIPDDVIRMMDEKGTYCVPTLSILVRLGRQAEETKREGWELRAKKLFGCKDIFQKMKKAGVPMGVGTDAVGENMALYPWFYFEEVERFVEYGCTPMEAIMAATKINAEICHASDSLGTIEKGKLADLLVLEDDPLADIKNLRRVRMIIQAGKVVKQ